MKYINSEKLKEKIYAEDTVSLAHGSSPEFDQGCHYAFLTVLSFINSLQQEQLIQANTLTWKDINDLERIINNVHYEFRNGIGEKSFGEEVLERFMEERDEQEQPKMDLEKFTDKIRTFQGRYKHPEIVSIKGAMAFMARMFYQYPNIARQWYNNLPKITMD